MRPGGTGNTASRATSAVLDGAIRAYQVMISPLLGPRCRFLPTCSAYARGSIAVHGPARGLALALRRVLRCHPFHPGGTDPVPAPTRAGIGWRAKGDR